MYNNISKYVNSIIGLIILAIGINITYATNLGAAPIEALNEGLANLFTIKTGTMTTITSIVLLSLSAIITRSSFKFQGAIGGIILGLLINITRPYIIINGEFSFLILLIFTFLGATLIGIGTVITIDSKKIIGYNDAFLVQIANKFFPRKNIGLLKIIYDLHILIVVFILNIYFNTFIIGIGSILLAFAIGLNIKWVIAIEKLIIKEAHSIALKDHNLFRNNHFNGKTRT
jgi:uncharacterized membrane protein YczE